MTGGGSGLFGGTDLATRIEGADCQLLVDAVKGLQRREPAGAFFRTFAGGVATWAGPGSPMNKVAGLGLAGPVGDGDLGTIERWFAERETPVQLEVSTLADPSLFAQLIRRGYVVTGFENVLGRTLPQVSERPRVPTPGLKVADSQLQDLDLWLDVMVAGFARPDGQGPSSHEKYPRRVVARAVGAMAAGPGFRRFLARRQGQPAGAASMRIHDRLAQLCGSATLPDHRCRGVQSALLDRRLALAAQAGCDLVVVVTQPGSRSQQNVQRLGFQLLYSRAILLRPLAVPR